MASETEPSYSPGLMALAQANNFFAASLHRLLAEEEGNVFFSPFSISTAMSMLLSAAEGATEAELRRVLGHDHAGIGKDDLASVFQQQMSNLKNPDSYTLDCANSMLCQRDFEIKEKYKSILSESFRSLLLEVDFLNDTTKVVNQINDWVKEKTKNMIPKLIESLDPATVIVLINAVYFKGNWTERFDERCTCPQNFYNKGENAKLVKMMHLTESFPFVENESFQALQLPFAGEEIAMLVLLPRKKNGLKSLEDSLIPSFVHDLKNQMVKKKVEVSLPRFRLEYSKSLVPCFKRLGVGKVFCRGAELGVASDSKDLAVSEIIHKAFLEVNEEGSAAAAATMVGVMLCCLSFDPVFVADHPFAFVIYDVRSGLILFMGRVDEL